MLFRSKVFDKHIGAEPVEQAAMLRAQQLVRTSCCRGEVAQGTGSDLGGGRTRGVLRAEKSTVAVVIVGTGVEQGGILRTDRQQESLLQRVKADEVAQDVAANRKEKRVSAAFEALEEICAAETDEPLAGAGEVFHYLGFVRRRRLIGSRLQIVGETVARQMQQADSIHHAVRVEPCVLVVRILFADAEGECLRLALGEVESVAAFKD